MTFIAILVCPIFSMHIHQMYVYLCILLFLFCTDEYRIHSIQYRMLCTILPTFLFSMFWDLVMPIPKILSFPFKVCSNLQYYYSGINLAISLENDTWPTFNFWLYVVTSNCLYQWTTYPIRGRMSYVCTLRPIQALVCSYIFGSLVLCQTKSYIYLSFEF